MKRYYAIQQLDRVADIYIFGDIVPLEFFEGDISAAGIVGEIKDLAVDEIRVHIDSYGGAVSEGWAIYNALRQHPARVVTYGDGFVASAALYPFLAGEERVASNLSAYFFHRVSIRAEGYSDELRAAADEADMMTDIGIGAFAERTNMDEAEVRQLMDGETWLTPTEALERGLATSITADAALPIAQAAKKSIMQRVFFATAAEAARYAEPKEQEHKPETAERENEAAPEQAEPTLKDIIKRLA